MEFRNPFINARVVGTNVDPKEYHALKGTRGHPDFVMSRSELGKFASCPRRWLLGYADDEETDSTEFGSVFDCMVLSGDDFPNRFSVCPEKYPDSKSGEPKDWTFQAKYCKDWRANEEAAGKQVIKHDVFEKAKAAAKRLFSDEENRAFLECCDSQVFVRAEYLDSDTKIVVPVKALLDLLPDASDKTYGKCIPDLKTACSADPRQWAKSVADKGYHTQAALYLDLYVAATGEDRTTFLHLIVENFEPWEFARSFMTSEFLEFGRMNYLSALRLYCQCLSSGHWPGYNTPQNSWPTLPGWRKCDPPMWMFTQAAGSLAREL